MSTAFDSWIERARNVPIEHVIERRGICLNGRTDRAGPCPLCGGANHFSVNLKKQCWNCRGCKPAEIKGDVIGFVQWHDRCDFLKPAKV